MSDRSQFAGRRTALKKISGAAITLVGSTGPAIAGANSQRGSKYVGYKYNPVTGEILGKAKGKLDKNGEELNGVLSIGNGRINVARDAPNSRSETGRGPVRRFDQQLKAVKKRPDKRISIRTVEDSITGYVRLPSREKVAFALKPESPQSRKDIKSMIQKAAPAAGNRGDSR